MKHLIALIALTAAVPALAAAPQDRLAQFRQRFIDIEQIARLPAGERQRLVPQLYRELSEGLRNSFLDGLMSSIPQTFVLDPAQTSYRYRSVYAPTSRPSATLRPQTPEAYRTDIDEAAATMTAEQVADGILKHHGSLLIQVAAQRRCMQTLVAHQDVLRPLVDEDLKSQENTAVIRAIQTISELSLPGYTDRIVSIYLDRSKAAVSVQAMLALCHLGDITALQRILADVGDSPESLKRHELVLSLLGRERPAEPRLMKFLDSADAGTRELATRILGNCLDDALAPHARRLAADKDARVRAAAVTMACGQSQQTFDALRATILPLLADESIDVRCAAAIGLGMRQDMSAAETLLSLLGDTSVPMTHHIAILNAVSRLSGQTFGYRPGVWGADDRENFKAMAHFRDWILAHPTPNNK